MLRLLANIVTQEERVVYVILVNSLALFFDAFPSIHVFTGGWLGTIDTFCTLYFGTASIFGSSYWLSRHFFLFYGTPRHLLFFFYCASDA